MMRSLVLPCLLAAMVLPAAAEEPAAKIPPNPAQGTVSPSGKFTPAFLPPDTNVYVPKTAAEAEAALRRTLDVVQTGSNTFRLRDVEFNKAERTVTVPAIVRDRDQLIEYALVTTRGKGYESLFTTDTSPRDIHLAFLLMGVSPVPVLGDLNAPAPVPATNAIRVGVSWRTNGVFATHRLSELIWQTNRPPGSTGPAMTFDDWLYNGSEFNAGGFAAVREGSVISVIRDPSALLNNPGADRDNDLIHWPNRNLLPPEGTPVSVVFSLPRPGPPPPGLPPLPGVTPVTPLSTNRY
jgi:hypothetical protein